MLINPFTIVLLLEKSLVEIIKEYCFTFQNSDKTFSLNTLQKLFVIDL